jgi:hypothetical protein
MKKTFLIALLLLGASVSITAQSVKFGIKGGVNYANQTGTDIKIDGTNYKTDAITSYHAGLVAEIKLLKKVAIQPELLYSTQGATYKNAANDFKNEIGYLSIPALLKLYLSNSISLDLGPQASFLMSDRKSFDALDNNTYNFSVVGGLGLNITKSIFIQGRYVLGLTEPSKNAETKNSIVQVSAGILF